ncbi:MAG: hypothetical protein HY520_00675 [Candidatus Aenigmarchaeota archaeon]|nr:hypothetical protein [Candidatus Aenigmarchaeota archaeon]
MRAICEGIQQLLRERGIPHQVVTHAAVFTSEEAAQVRGVPLEWGVKAMVLKARDHFILVCIRADKKVDFHQVKRWEGTSKIRLATAPEVLQLTGCEIGSVPPFGHLQPLQTYLDQGLLAQEKVTFNIGLHEVSVVMAGKDLTQVMDATLF